MTELEALVMKARLQLSRTGLISTDVGTRLIAFGIDPESITINEEEPYVGTEEAA